jgi:leader peptidase (prepilin peptidase)/N-methyltransferase
MQFYEMFAGHVPWLTFWVFGLGACIGSFLNVVIWRIPREESIVHVPSHCPKCDKKIRPWENIPIISWLCLRGKCSKCKAPISPRYIFIEALTALLFVAVWMRAWRIYSLAPQRAWHPSMILMFCVLIALLVAISFIDIDHRIVPDRIVLFGVIVAVVGALVWPGSHGMVSAPRHLDHLNHKLALKAILSVFARFAPGVLNSARWPAAIDSLMGALLGGGVLWLLSEVGKLLRGKTTIESDEIVTLILKRKGFEDPEEGFQEWEDTFIRTSDKLIVKGKVVLVELRSKAKSEKPKLSDDIVDVVVTEDEGVQFDDAVIPLDDIKSIAIETQEWTIPLEPMGLGDATLMAMVGAFLGPGGVIFTLTLGSFVGAGLGIMKIVFDRAKMHSSLPFGPSLAIGAVCYMLIFNEVVLVWFKIMNLFNMMPGGS